MMGLTQRLEAIYPYMPIVIQNLMITGQGYLFRRNRFAAGFYTALAAHKDRAGWQAEQLADYQLAKLRAFLKHADTTSPFWKSRMAAAGVTPDDIQSLTDLQRIPVLEKEELRQQAAQIQSDAYDPSSLAWVHSSGTTGTPISVAFTSQDMQTRFAFLYRMFALFDVPPLARSIRFSGRTLFPNARKNGVFWRMNWAMSQMLMSSYDLHPNNLQAYVDRIASFNPVLIDGYPSSIFVVARFINQTGQQDRIRPKAIMTTAETLEDYQRDEISQAFGGCHIINQYASSEGAPFITEDLHGDLVVNTDTGVFEFVRPGTDVPAAPGELAEMLLTSFTTHAFPLIRYRIGDTVIMPQKPRMSACWEMPVVDQILGRQEDIIWTPERGYVGRLDPVFKKTPSTIIESQIVQTAPMGFDLNVVPDHDNGYAAEQLDPVMKEMRARLGDIDIRLVECAALERGPSAKLRAVIGLDGNGPHTTQGRVE